jgi:hypothetical protein
MKIKSLEERRRSVGFGDVIANVSVRGFFHELIDILSNLHEDVDVRRSPVDIRAEYGARTICRIVPYRELIHLHVGDSRVWEARIRDEAGFLDAVDRILDVYLTCVARDASANSTRFTGAALSR